MSEYMHELSVRPTPNPATHDVEPPGASLPVNEGKDRDAEKVDDRASDHKVSFHIPLRQEIPFVFIICSSNIVTQASLGMTIAPLSVIGKSFGILNPGQMSWFVAAFSLTVGTFILIAGRLGDMFGHKRLFIGGFLWYGLWSLVTGFSAFSHSQIFFDFTRAMQGIGPAMMVPNSLAILGHHYPPGRRKEFVFALYGATAPNGFICGSVFGSLLAKYVWWPWEFWIMAVACFLLGLLGIMFVPSTQDASMAEKVDRFDYLGATTGVAGLVLFNVAWNQAPIVGWGNPYVIIFLIIGIILTAFYLYIETKVSQPLIPQQVLSGKVGFVLGCIALGWASFGIWIYYYFQFIEHLRHVTPLLGAAQNAAAGPAGICAALTTAYLLSRVPTSWIMAMAMLPFCIGNILLSTMPVQQTYWLQTFLSTIITPWGMDMSFPAGTIILSDLVPRECQGIAASLVVTVVNYSISLGLGIAGTVESHVNDNGQDLLKGYRGAFYAAIGLSGTGFILAIFFVLHENRSRDRSR